MPHKAFVLAAGFGKRLRPYTLEFPKPMTDVAGRSLVDRTLDHLEKSGITNVVVNTHYLADKLENHLRSRDMPRITISHEDTLLDTGGGIKKALDHFDREPFFVLSGDGLWVDGPNLSALERLSNFWNPEIMDILMLLQPVSSMSITKGVGDYDLDDQGHAIRSLNRTGRYMFTSIRINRPEIFQETPDGSFSYLDLMDQAQERRRLYGLVHDGDWYHISTPDDLNAVRAVYERETKSIKTGT